MPSVCENDSETEIVEVIGIGSRKEAVLDFCLESPLNTSSLRFWNILTKDSSPNVQMEQRFIGEDKASPPRILEPSMFLESRAVILLATAGYGTDHIAAIDILRMIKSKHKFTIAIILNPFSFEGKRRLDEVKHLVSILQDHTNFCIDIETDRLLEKDLVTLDEALRTANNAVLLAINAVSIIISDMHNKFIDIAHDNVKKLEFSEVIRILGNYKESKIGFGAGSSLKTSILQAIDDCPFIGASIKELNGVVICVVMSSNHVDDSFELQEFSRAFRQITKYNGEIMISFVHEPNLEQDLMVTTVVTLGSLEKQRGSKKSSIMSKLANQFPFFFNLLKRPNDNAESKENQRNNTVENPGLSEDPDESKSEPSIYYIDKITEGAPFQREPLHGWNMGPGHQIAQKWAKERAATHSGANTPTLENLSIFSVPVGVKPLEEYRNNVSVIVSDTRKQETKTDRSDFKAIDVGKKQSGMLLARAASMLESERDSPKKWAPVVEMDYRGGLYIGQCQGGLPEGKGRLVLENGCIYDGMWRYGKKSGTGTFYFGNGDVFQGSWRDDVMHGKGWFYFQSGDRWFANFWKGKANGKGRFYSKDGQLFFGDFKDGWRHGKFLCVDVDGERCVEIWDEGVLVSRKPLKSEDDDSGSVV